MKKLSAIILLLAALLMTVCCAAPAEEPQKPEQEILFIITTANSSYSTEKSAAAIDVNGGYHYLPDDFSFDSADWYQTAAEASRTEAVRSIEASHLSIVYTFFNDCNADKYREPVTYDGYIADYRSRSLYRIYTSPDGSADHRILCQYGQNISCVDDERVKTFVNRMCDNGYFFVDDNFRY